MKPAKNVAGLEKVFQSATNKMEGLKNIVDEWGRLAQIRKELDLDQV